MMNEKVGELIDGLTAATIGEHGYGLVGAVVGATFPETGRKLRELLPRSIFLIPGWGAQGGDAAGIGSFFDRQGHGALVSASRSIIGAGSASSCLPEAFARICRRSGAYAQ